jgi:hypothetical protein
MAQHNPDARAYLLIVLGSIVVCFVIAGYLLGGHQSEAGAMMDASHSSSPSHAETKPLPTKSDEAPDAITPKPQSLDAVPENPPPTPDS